MLETVLIVLFVVGLMYDDEVLVSLSIILLLFLVASAYAVPITIAVLAMAFILWLLSIFN